VSVCAVCSLFFFFFFFFFLIVKKKKKNYSQGLCVEATVKRRHRGLDQSLRMAHMGALMSYRYSELA
jgi:hypothetical protein